MRYPSKFHRIDLSHVEPTGFGMRRFFRFWLSHLSLCGGMLACLSMPTVNAQSPRDGRSADGYQHSGNKLISLSSLNSKSLIHQLQELLAGDHLWLLGDANLAGTRRAIPGWRWESTTVDGTHVVLAIEDGLMVAICESERGSIDMSYYELPELYPSVLRRLSSQASSVGRSKVARVRAMSAKHLSRTSRDAFQLYFRYAGPIAELVPSRAHLPPVW